MKLIATKGGQTFTALFNSRGQALGADTPTAATYQLKQGQAVSVTVRLRLTAATTAATQAFEGVLKLTFQLPANLSADRQAAILEAARKAAQQVEEALAKKSPLSAIPGLRGTSPSLDKSEVAARLVATIGSAGETSQLENFRTAVTNLGIFDSLFKATQAELLAVAAEKLETRDGLAPIMARDFPLDRVVISGSGLLGFSGQKSPIQLGGAVTSNFVPSSSGGSGGGSNADTGGGVQAPEDTAFVWPGIPNAMGVGIYGDDVALGNLRNGILVTDSDSGALYRLSAITASPEASFTLPLITGRLSGVAPVDSGTSTIMVSVDAVSGYSDAPSVARYAWDDVHATYTLEASGAAGVRAGGGVVAGGRYWQFSGSVTAGPGFSNICSWPLTGTLDNTASETLMIDDGASRRPLDIDTDVPGPTNHNSYGLAVDADGTATRVYWVTFSGHLIRYADEGGVATATVLATPSDFVGADISSYYGGVALAPEGDRLYVARGGKAYYMENPAATSTTPGLSEFAPGTVPLGSVFAGAQSRPGSVLFSVGATSVIRIPTPPSSSQ